MSVGFADPRRAVGQKDILAQHVGIIGFHPVPRVAVHEGHGAAFDLQYFFARHTVVGIIRVEILTSVTAGHIDEITHFRIGQIGQPVGDLDLQGQIGDKHAVGDGTCTVGVPLVVGTIARTQEKLRNVHFQQFAVNVVGKSHVARVINQLRKFGILFDNILGAKELV